MKPRLESLQDLPILRLKFERLMMNAPLPQINSLGFAKPPSETRVVVAMSGGVDSSVVAAMLAPPRLRTMITTIQYTSKTQNRVQMLSSITQCRRNLPLTPGIYRVQLL